MKKIKTGLIFIALCIMYYVFFISEDKVMVYDVYCGVPYNGRLVFYAMTLLMYMCYSMNIYGEQENYISGYGILTLTRNKDRIQILNIFSLGILKNIAIVEILKNISFFLMSILLKKNIVFNGVDIYLLDIVEFIMSMFIFMFIQMIFEISISSNVSLAISATIFMGVVFISDLIERAGILGNIQYLIFSNAMMNLRKNNFVKTNMQHMFLICCMILIWIVIYGIARRYFEKRDFV